jgi:hypothetical protein
MTDLWPDQFGTLSLPPPILTMREQATIISNKTGGRIVAEVATARHGNNFEHVFLLVAPFLDDYRYQLFRVIHPVDLYPLELHADVMDQILQCKTSEEFETALRTIFASPQTIKVVRAILAQTDAVRS